MPITSLRFFSKHNLIVIISLAHHVTDSAWGGNWQEMSMAGQVTVRNEVDHHHHLIISMVLSKCMLSNVTIIS